MSSREPRALTSVLSRFIEPMEPTAVRELPTGNVWTYEAKLDGYRCLASTRDIDVALWSRRGCLVNSRFPEIVRACAKLPPDTVIDGEIIAIDETGKVSCNALQQRRATGTLQYYVFDVLMHRGRSLLSTRLELRRVQLSELLRKVGYPVILAQSFNAGLMDPIQAAKQLQIEGLIAKHRGSYYEPGNRTQSWLKYKVHRSQAFVIGGFTVGEPFDALMVGHYKADRLMYAAKVRNGFTAQLRHELTARLNELQTTTCPFANFPADIQTRCAFPRNGNTSYIWVKPQCVAQVEFTAWTSDGRLRNPRWLGSRDDQNPLAVIREEEA